MALYIWNCSLWNAFYTIQVNDHIVTCCVIVKVSFRENSRISLFCVACTDISSNYYFAGAWIFLKSIM